MVIFKKPVLYPNIIPVVNSTHLIYKCWRWGVEGTIDYVSSRGTKYCPMRKKNPSKILQHINKVKSILSLKNIGSLWIFNNIHECNCNRPLSFKQKQIIFLKLYLHIPAILPQCYIIVIIEKVGQFLKSSSQLIFC